MDTIQIISDSNQQGPSLVWMAKYSDQETLDAFGTDTLPTPFFCTMDRAEVVRIIQGLNPEWKVY